MSYFSAQPAFQFQGQQAPSLQSENEPPKQWNFPQAYNPSFHGKRSYPQTNESKVTDQVKIHRKKRSSSDDESIEPEQQIFANTYFEGAPAKKRKGLSETTVPIMNATGTTNF